MSWESYAGYAEEAAEDAATLRNPKARVRFMTKDMEMYAPCGDFRDIKFADKRNATGQIVLTVPDNDVWEEYFYGQDPYAVRPIVVDLPHYRTVWFTTTFARIRERKTRKKLIQVVGVHPMQFWDAMRIFPNAAFPPEFQWPKDWSGLAPAATLLASGAVPNLIRLQAALWSIPTGNLFKLETYNLLKNAMWPIMVNPRKKGLADGTEWTATTARMDKFIDVATDVCKAENIDMTWDLYIHGEDEQPFPEFFTLNRTTLIADFVRYGDPIAFEGNALTGLIRTGRKMAEDAIEWITYPILNPEDDDPELEAIAVYRYGTHSTVEEAEEITHIPLATRATVGGKSPEWLNQAIVTGMNLLLGAASSAASTVIPGFPALELGIFEDQVTDVVMAFHSQEDLQLANEAGPWRFREAGSFGTTGLSLNAVAEMKTTLHDNRGYQSNKITVSNGAGGYYIGKHIKKGYPLGHEDSRGRIRVDHLEEIGYEYSRSVKGNYTLQIGSGDAEKAPGDIALGKIRKLGAWITRVALAS